MLSQIMEQTWVRGVGDLVGAEHAKLHVHVNQQRWFCSTLSDMPTVDTAASCLCHNDYDFMSAFCQMRL